jgi:Sec-independent protein secretion pathway component TatC
MWISVGIVELALVVLTLMGAGILAVLGKSAWRWALALFACATAAAVLSPADPVSTILLGAVLFLFFASGVRFGKSRSPAAARADGGF